MERLFKDYTFKQLYKYVKKWTWQEIQYAYNELLISQDNVMYYADSVLEEGCFGFNDVLGIVISEWYDDITVFLQRLASFETPQQGATVKDKWLFAMLLYVLGEEEKFGGETAIYFTMLFDDFGYFNSRKPIARVMFDYMTTYCLDESYFEQWRIQLRKCLFDKQEQC